MYEVICYEFEVGEGSQKRNPLSKTDTISAESTSLRGQISVWMVAFASISLPAPVEGADADI
jgi:hypothetical protein